jgi:protein-disulfide isomerase
MKFSFVSLLTSFAFACAALAPLASGAEDKPLSKADVEAIVKQVIKDNPELVMKVLSDYQEKEELAHISKAAQNLTRMQDKIARDPRAPAIGNPKGDVTVVEFFDYHCGYCKRFYPEIAKLLHDDKNVRVVFKEFPILSPDSDLAARAALAVYNINKAKYFDYHILLMQTNSEFTEAMLTDKAKEVGIDAEAFRKAFHDPEISKDIDRNKVLANNLAITGTPSIIVGTEFMPGAISYEILSQKVQEARDNQTQNKGAEKSAD